MKVKELTDECYGSGHRVLYCPDCGASYSAHNGDYFMLPAEKELTCCGEPLLRGQFHTRFQEG